MKSILFLFCIVMSSVVSFAGEQVVAKVNGESITNREFEQALHQLIRETVYHGRVSEEKRNELSQKALKELIERELLYQDAVAKGMKPDKREVNKREITIRNRFPSKKEYKKRLKEAGMTEDDVREMVEKAVLSETNFRMNVTEPAQMSEAALKDYYNKNVDKFKEPESRRVRIISARDRNKVSSALAKVNAGTVFSEVAAMISEDNYQTEGGDMGYVQKGTLPQELEQVAFQMKVGEVRGPVKAEDKWFLIKVEDKKDSRQVMFEECRENLKTELQDKRVAELKEKWIAGLRAKAKIEILLEVPSGH